MDLAAFQEQIKFVSLEPYIILGSAKTFGLDSKRTPAFTDPKYLPFYFFLGGRAKPKSVVQFGSELGLPAACLARGAKTIESFLLYDPELLSTASMIRSNAMKFLSPDAKFEYRAFDEANLPSGIDLAIVTSHDPVFVESVLQAAWPRIAPEGLIAIDYISDEAVSRSWVNFCESANREPVQYRTRYGCGIVSR